MGFYITTNAEIAMTKNTLDVTEEDAEKTKKWYKNT